MLCLPPGPTTWDDPGLCASFILSAVVPFRAACATKVQHHDNYCDMLSSRLLRRPARQWLSSTSVASSAPKCRPPARAFHASAPRQDPMLDAVLYVPHEMMNLIHANVPWYAAIPLTAFVTRGLLVTTAGAWARAIMARYLGLHPLRQALAFQKRDEILQRGNFRTTKEATLTVKKEVNEEVAKLDKRWNVTLRGQLGWTLAQIPIFFAMAEAIRQKCGARDGLLGLGFSAFKGKNAETAVGDLADGAQIAVGDLGDYAQTTVADIALDAQTSLGNIAGTTSTWFEPSLANEGMLWFQNLLLPDPTGALPFVVSALMFTNIYITKNSVDDVRSWSLLIRRSLLGVSLLIGPLCQAMPAALMLYWTSSTSSVMLWNAWLDWKYPAPRNLTACKRPLQKPPKPMPIKSLPIGRKV
jgi:inner membrane protein COX18